jgi:hypothetical protein
MKANREPAAKRGKTSALSIVRRMRRNLKRKLDELGFEPPEAAMSNKPIRRTQK